MIRRLLTYVVIMLPMALAASGIVARVKGLENNPEYMSLLLQENGFKIREDSINGALSSIRSKFSIQGEDRAALGREILRLESDVFEVRNSLGIIVGKIADIEQTYVINNLDVAMSHTTSTEPQPPILAETSNNLTGNKYFKDNLSKGDYTALEEAQKRERSITNYLKIYSNNYGAIKELVEGYAQAQSAASADSLHTKYDQLFRINRIIADSVGILWDKVFDDKSYAYNYIFDKLNKTAELSDFESRIRGAAGELSQEMNSTEVHRYTVLKPLLLNYEIKLAKSLGLTKALDSLSTALKELNIKELTFPKMEIVERNFITYEPLGAPITTLYKASNPIPKVEVMPRGIIYRVLVGTYTRTQPPAIFKGINPLSYQHEDNQVLYFAGGFKTQPEAETALESIVKLGFKKATVVVWNNGQYSNLTEQVDQSTPEDSQVTDIYRVELLTTEETLSDRIKETIAQMAADKELSRVTSEAGYTYIIGSFDTIEAAQRVATAIGGLQNGVNTKVTKIKAQ